MIPKIFSSIKPNLFCYYQESRSPEQARAAGETDLGETLSRTRLVGGIGLHYFLTSRDPVKHLRTPSLTTVHRDPEGVFRPLPPLCPCTGDNSDSAAVPLLLLLFLFLPPSSVRASHHVRRLRFKIILRCRKQTKSGAQRRP